MEKLFTAHEAIGRIAWGPPMIFLLLGTGIFLSARCGFFQVRRLGAILRETGGGLFQRRRDDGKNLSSFQAAAMSLAGCVGTGNIAGVTGALIIGGPGAVFWMWVSALFGMCTKYAEIALAVKYRVSDENGLCHGGPMVTIERGLGPRWRSLAVSFALLAALASFGIGNLAQSTEIAAAMSELFGVDRVNTGIVLAGLTALVLLGGARSVGRFTAVLVPLMALLYLLAGVVVLLLHLSEIPAALWLIVKSAFSLRAVGGGVFGRGIFLAMRQGLARGVFSNEAGLGSAALAHASASAERPEREALWGVFEVFTDTMLISTVTALTVILSGVLDSANAAAPGAVAALAFARALPGSLGGLVIRLSLILFALSTIMSWGWYGGSCWRWLCRGSEKAELGYQLLFAATCVVGAAGAGELMWGVADTLNALMAIPNLLSLLLLSSEVAEIARKEST